MQVFESWNQVYSVRNEKVRKNFHPNCGSLLYRDRLLSDCSVEDGKAIVTSLRWKISVDV